MKSTVQFSSGLIAALAALLVLSTSTAVRAQCCAGSDPNHNYLNGANDAVYASVRQADGKVIIGGAFTSYNGQPRYYITRLNAFGADDNTFINGLNGPVYGLALDSNGGVVAVGAFTSPKNGIMRFSANGSYDASFNPPPIDYHPYAVAVQADNTILVGGSHSYIGGCYRPRIARLGSDGAVDCTFNAGPIDCAVYTITLHDGLFIGGSFTTVGWVNRGGIAKLDATTGNVDPNWPAAGMTLANGTVYAIERDQSGRKFIGGDFTSFNGNGLARYIARLDANGVETAPPEGQAPNGPVRAIRLLEFSSDEMAIGGDFTTVGSAASGGFARIHSNMSLMCGADPGFQGGTPTSVRTLIAILQVPSYTYKVICGGNFTSFNGTARGRIVQLCLPCCN